MNSKAGSDDSKNARQRSSISNITLNDSLCYLAEPESNVQLEPESHSPERLSSRRQSIWIGDFMKDTFRKMTDELGTLHLSSTMGNFSLLSMQYSDGDLHKPLPLPGRESHTASLERFEFYREQMRSVKRDEKSTRFNKEFWEHVRTFLQMAKKVGYDERFKEEVQHKGPRDGDAFLEKMAKTDMINPIHPTLIAQSSGMPLQDVITELLHAVAVGMMTMSWGPACVRCNVITCSKSNLNETSHFCDNCQYEHTEDALSKIQIVFSFVNEVFFTLADNFLRYVSSMPPSSAIVFQPVPATFSGSGFRYSVGCGGERSIRPGLSKGRYHMHCPVSGTENYLVVERNAEENDKPVVLRLHVSDLTRNPGKFPKTVVATHGKIHFDVFTDTQLFFFLWIKDRGENDSTRSLPIEDQLPFTEVRDVIKNPSFHVLFGDTLDTRLSGALHRMKLTREN